WKMMPVEVGRRREKAVEEEGALREILDENSDKYDEEAQEVWEMALQLEGITRNVGKHAGGVVIAPDKLTDFCPLYCDESGEGLVTQFDKDDVEQAGLVKFDFLGLRTLTIIDWAKAIIDKRLEIEGKEPLVIEHIPLDDHPTFEMLKRAETTAVFQLESRGMKELIKKLKPSCFEDIVALVALYRPGPLQSGMVDDFIDRKHGRAEMAFPHPHYQHDDLKPVLKPTYGIILYQEQVMQIAQVLAKFSLGEADLLRRAMGKKKAEVMAEQRKIFIDGAVQNNLDEDLAGNIFDLMEKFAGYGFNKSHSAAYALVSYQTAWLKTHFPAEFMAAVLSADMQNTDKVVTLIEECRSMKLEVTPPNVNNGEFSFTVDEDRRIIYGLGAIKGLGEGPVEALIAARQSGGDFRDLFDFCERVDLKKVNKRALEALIRCGALDELAPSLPEGDNDLGYSRAIMFHAIADAVKMAEQSAHNQNSGMVDLFGDALPGGESNHDVYAGYRTVHPWSMRERLSAEKDTLGLYLTGHPIDEYLRELRRFVPCRISDLKVDRDRKPQVIAGLVVSMVVRKNQSGNEMATLMLDDRSGRIEVTLFNDAFVKYREKLVKDTLLVVEGNVRESNFNDSGGLTVRVSSVQTIAEARMLYVKALEISLDSLTVDASTLGQVDAVLQPFAGGACPVWIHYRTARASGRIRLGEEWRVSPEDDLLHDLQKALGKDSVELIYIE
ncbi:MAG: DNA polymerase III subunit alpha, partial [Pseudomonadales bacterium]|nr:DNA polymerase III subunit alpha [Pseudomonadales bacterium]